MQPLVLTNAFRRPRGTRLSSGVTVSSDTNVYACVEEMVDVIRDDLGATAVLLPTSFDEETVSRLLDQVDGVFLPGAVSNVHPSTYGAEVPARAQIFDQDHDRTDMFLAREAAKRGLPFLGVCRSMQALNVAFGGTLGFIDDAEHMNHGCSNPCDGHVDKPEFMHQAKIIEGGVLQKLFTDPVLSINSMHEQAVLCLSDKMRVEAVSPDGVVEAISLKESANFCVGVQWHPEAMPKNAVSQKIFAAFRAAIDKSVAKRRVG